MKILIPILIFAIAVMMPNFAVADEIDRMSQESSYTFSPGYINAAKYQADSFLKVNIPDYKPKGVFDSAMDFVKGIVGFSARERTAPKEVATPVLQQKTSATNRPQVGAIDGAVLISVPINNALVEQATGKISQLAGVNKGDIRYEALSNGDTVFLWVSNNTLYSQTYNSECVATTGQPNAIPGLYNTRFDVKALNNGRFVLSYSTYEEGTKYTKFSIFDSNGASAGSYSSVCNSEVTSITGLANGGFAASWNGYNITPGVHNDPYFMTFNSTASATSSRISLASNGYVGDPRLATLTNGNVVAVWSGFSGSSTGVYYGIYNGENFTSSKIREWNLSQDYVRVSAFSDGGFLISWSELEGPYETSLSYVWNEKFDSKGESEWMTMAQSDNRTTKNKGKTTKNDAWTCTYKTVDIVELTNGDFLVTYSKDYGQEGIYAKVFTKDGAGKSYNIRPFGEQFKPGGAPQIKAYALSDGTFALDGGKGYGYTFHYQFTPTGSMLSTKQIFDMPVYSFGRPTDTSAAKSQSTSYDLAEMSRKQKEDTFSSGLFDENKGKMDSEAAGLILKDMLKNKNSLSAAGGAEINDAIARVVGEEFTKEELISRLNSAMQADHMELAMKLASILSNPTEDQKAMIDVAISLITDMDNIEGQMAANPELKKASDELLQVIANILLAQAIPDLLKEGDMANIKSIFSNLDSAKTKVILEYNESTRPYYDEVKKILQRNAEALQLSNVLRKGILQKEMEELPRSEIDKIIEKLKAKEKRTFEEEYILQQSAKYKERYVEPNKKKFEENMKAMMQEFAKRLSATLETKDKK